MTGESDAGARAPGNTALINIYIIVFYVKIIYF